MLVGAVARVNHRYKLRGLGSNARGPRLRMAQHNRVSVSLEDTNGVLERLALVDRSHGLWILDIQRLPAQAFDRAGERAERAAGRLEEQESDNPAGQELRSSAGQDEFFHLQGRAKDGIQILRRELVQRDNILAPKISL